MMQHAMTLLSLLVVATVMSVSAIPGELNNYVHYKRSMVVENLSIQLDSNVTFGYNATKITVNHQRVKVTWSGVSNPGPSDYITQYVGPNADSVDPSMHMPVQASVWYCPPSCPLSCPHICQHSRQAQVLCLTAACAACGCHITRNE